jgi:hypothetical protein
MNDDWLPLDFPFAEWCQLVKVRLECDTEAGLLERVAADQAVSNVEEQAAVTFNVKVWMVTFRQLSFGVGQILEAEAVVMPVSFAVIDAKNSQRGEVLVQRDERHVREIFACLKCGSTMFDFKMASQAEVE